MTTYVFVAVGVFMIWARAREGGFVWSWRSLLGWSLVGWGLFNLVEGVVDHHILQIHHVRRGPMNWPTILRSWRSEQGSSSWAR